MYVELESLHVALIVANFRRLHIHRLVDEGGLRVLHLGGVNDLRLDSKVIIALAKPSLDDERDAAGNEYANERGDNVLLLEPLPEPFIPTKGLRLRPVLERIGGACRPVKRAVHRHDQACFLVDAVCLSYLHFLIPLDDDSESILVV